MFRSQSQNFPPSNESMIYRRARFGIDVNQTSLGTSPNAADVAEGLRPGPGEQIAREAQHCRGDHNKCDDCHLMTAAVAAIWYAARLCAGDRPQSHGTKQQRREQTAKHD